MISSERYSVGSEDGRSISFQKEEGAFVGLDVTIKFKYVIVVIICAVAIMGGTSYYSSVCIPMAHGVDSLNVAAASAVAFWQLGKR